MANWFSALQVKSLLRDSPDIAKHLTSDWDAQTSNNTTGRRTFKRGTLYAKGAHNVREWAGFSVDDGIVDEFDKCPLIPEGSADTLTRGRMYASSAPKLICFSTPGIDGESRIQALIDDTYPEHVFRWQVPCIHCAHMQELVFGGADSSHGLVS